MAGRPTLAWLARDPAAVAGRLAALGLDVARGRVGLGRADLVVEDSGGRPDRLVPRSAAPASAGRRPAPGELELEAVGWATVELDRAAAARPDLPFEPAEPDEALGAIARAAPGIVLLEPSTEGRIAATLARHGEGPAVLYLLAGEGLDAFVERLVRRGARFGRRAGGPLGPSVLVMGGPTTGPHLVVCGSDTIGR